jgi:uncharacterized protein (DUF2267 family)
MSATGLDVFDKTLQTTHIWLDQISKELSCNRQEAWHALGAVLRPLRDRLTVEQSAHLTAQLPLLVRGLYYDQWHPAGGPSKERHEDDFLSRVSAGLTGIRPLDVRDTTQSVLRVLSHHVTGGQIQKITDALPVDIRALFPNVGTSTAK